MAPPSTSLKVIHRLYGVPISQPTRSVLWSMLLLQRAPAEMQLMVPGLDRPDIGARHESFRSKSKARSITVPLLEILDQNGESISSRIAIAESAAIMVHLCETTTAATSDTTRTSSATTTEDTSNSLEQYQKWLYGQPGTVYKANIDSYLHWHHTNTRGLARIASTYLMPGRARPQLQQEQQTVEIHKILKRLEHGWLRPSTTTTTDGHQISGPAKQEPSPFIAGGPLPSIADLMCYDEIVQVSWTGLVDLGSSSSNGADGNGSKDKTHHSAYPNLMKWIGLMEQVPYHDPVHAALKSLGPLVPSEEDNGEDVPLPKRLGRANKVGMQIIQQTLEEMNSKYSNKDAAETPRSKL